MDLSMKLDKLLTKTTQLPGQPSSYNRPYAAFSPKIGFATNVSS